MNTAINSHPVEPDLPIQDYAKKREAFARFVEAGVASSPSPERVAEKFLVAAEAEIPKLRYLVGKDAVRTAPLRRFVPASLFDRIFRASFKLDSTKEPS